MTYEHKIKSSHFALTYTHAQLYLVLWDAMAPTVLRALNASARALAAASSIIYSTRVIHQGTEGVTMRELDFRRTYEDTQRTSQVKHREI